MSERAYPGPEQLSKPADRLPPHAEAAEQGVLGCVLFDEKTAADTLNRLLEKRVTAEWFYDLRHQLIYQAMLGLHEKRDVPVELISLLTYLKDQGHLDEIGGVAYLNQLTDCVPSAANLLYYLDTVREKWITRQLIRTCTELVMRAYEGNKKTEMLLADAEHEVELLSGSLIEHKEVTIQKVLQESVIPQLEEHYLRGSQRLRGLPTGLTYTDKIVRGIRENYYYVVAARPGDGKTSWAMNLVEHVTSLDFAVGVFTLEMTADSLATRLLFSVADVDSGQFEQGFATKSDLSRLVAGSHKLAARKIYLDAEPDQSIEMIGAKARRWAKDYNIKLFVLDYLQLLDDESSRDRVQTLRRISKKIVSLKNKLKIPWVVLAQMNRNIETAEVRRAPVLSDLKECGAIEQDADLVMFLYPPLKIELEEKKSDGTTWNHRQAIAELMASQGVKKRDDWPRRVNAAISKNRYGPTGTAQLLFQSNRCRFYDWHDWATANDLIGYGAGDRASANPVEQELIGQEEPL